jgi:hypothetical protein
LLWRATDLFTWIQNGSLTVVISQQLPLSQAKEAHALLEGRKTVGKLLLKP